MNSIKQMRTAYGHSVSELATRARIAEFELEWMELGGVPRADDVIRLMRFFGCGYDDLYPHSALDSDIVAQIASGAISADGRSELRSVTIDPDPRHWYFCARLHDRWRHFYIRSHSAREIEAVLATDRDSYISFESCGHEVVLNCQHVSAYQIAVRRDFVRIEQDRLAERELGVVFVDAPETVQRFRFCSNDSICAVFEQIEFGAPSADPYIEFSDGDNKMGLAPESIAMLTTSLATRCE